MHFITCFSDIGENYRTFGYFNKLEDCYFALHENFFDMNEAGYYTYAVIEKIVEGIHSPSKQIEWFAWNEEKEGFFETEKPEWANGWCNFALG